MTSQACYRAHQRLEHTKIPSKIRTSTPSEPRPHFKLKGGMADQAQVPDTDIIFSYALRNSLREPDRMLNAVLQGSVFLYRGITRQQRNDVAENIRHFFVTALGRRFWNKRNRIHVLASPAECRAKILKLLRSEQTAADATETYRQAILGQRPATSYFLRAGQGWFRVLEAEVSVNLQLHSLVNFLIVPDAVDTSSLPSLLPVVNH